MPKFPLAEAATCAPPTHGERCNEVRSGVYPGEERSLIFDRAGWRRDAISRPVHLQRM
ncbi:hypothetical protein KCP70_16880 [Salmonella enterica subsp. enterica]|nr:hypothetical protein KCP70_16880 [Salmonella enterica subsp. enterica]